MRPIDLILPILLFLCFMAVNGASTLAYGQLISPGELTESHRNLEGIKNCTNCHELGNRGIINTLCLDCHTPLQSRIDSSVDTTHPPMSRIRTAGIATKTISDALLRRLTGIHPALTIAKRTMS